MPPKLSDDDLAAARVAFESGRLSIRRIAVKLQVSHTAIAKRARRLGWTRPVPPGEAAPPIVAPSDTVVPAPEHRPRAGEPQGFCTRCNAWRRAFDDRTTRPVWTCPVCHYVGHVCRVLLREPPFVRPVPLP
jgi:hypothetical protein